nr:unnamed protein product [Spirometra erinaceieuropaei]
MESAAAIGNAVCNVLHVFREANLVLFQCSIQLSQVAIHLTDKRWDFVISAVLKRIPARATVGYLYGSSKSQTLRLTNLRFPNLSQLVHYAMTRRHEYNSEFWGEDVISNLELYANAAFHRRKTLSCILE